MAVAGREVGGHLDTFELMLYRSAIGVLIVAAVLTARGHWAQVRTRHAGLHLVRSVAHFTGQNLWFFAVTVIPLAQVFALEFTQPVWVVLMAPLFLGERLTRRRLLVAVMGFAGILIVVRPGAHAIDIGVISAALAALFFAFTTLFTKRLTRSDSISGILFWLTGIQLILGLIAAGYDGDITLPDAQSAPWVLVVALAGLFAHLCVTSALSLAPATFVIPIDFARVPTIALVGMVLYGEAPDFWVFAGTALILAANYLNIVAGKQQ